MDGRDVELARVRIQVLQHGHPDRRNAGGDRHFFPLEQIDQAGWIQVRPWHHQLGAEHHRGEGEPPRVGVEHRDDGKDRVALGDVHTGAEREAEGVEHERAVRVEHAFRLTGGASGVAHGRRLVLLRLGQIHRRLGLGEQRFVFQIARRHRLGRADDDDGLDGRNERANLLPERQQRFVDQQELVLRVIDDVGELLGVEAEVEGVEDAADERDGEIGLEVRAVVPGERGDAVAGDDAEVGEGAGEPPGAVAEVAHGVAVNRLVREARDDLATPVDRLPSAEDGRQGERVVHHEAVHARDCMRNGPRVGVGTPYPRG